MHPVYLNFYFAGIYIKYGPILSIERRDYSAAGN